MRVLPDCHREGRTTVSFPPPLWGRAREGVSHKHRLLRTPTLTPPREGQGNAPHSLRHLGRHDRTDNN